MGYGDTIDRAHAILKRPFDAEGVSIPFPQIDVHLPNAEA